VSALDAARDERGTTMVELLVGLAIGMTILSALTLVVVVTMHGSARVSARVEATQNGRIVLTRITEELHSACIYPKFTPIQAGSTGTSLRFVHAASGEGASVAPTPVLSQITLNEGTLTQYDYAVAGGTTPNWTFSETPSSTRQLMTGVAPIPGSSAIFTYYSYSSGSLSELSASPSLSASDATLTINVRIALNAEPRTTPVKDAGANSNIQDSAVLRLTPPSFNESATALPCR